MLSLVLGATDTPALSRLLARRGVLAGADDGSPIPGAVRAEEVAEQAIAQLPHGPSWFVGDLLREGAQHLGAMPRNDAVRLMIEMGGGLMGAGQEASA